MIENPPAMQETLVQSLGHEDLLEEETATHSSILAWTIPWTEEPAGLQSIESQKSQTQLSYLACFPGGSEVKASASNVGDPGLIPGSGRSPGEGNGNPCMEKPGRLQSTGLQRVGHD